jgi:hypothetical protein
VIYGNNPTPFVGVVVLNPTTSPIPAVRPLTVLHHDRESYVRDLFASARRQSRPLRIAATDTRNLHIVAQLVSLGGLNCDMTEDAGWVTVEIREVGE